MVYLWRIEDLVWIVRINPNYFLVSFILIWCYYSKLNRGDGMADKKLNSLAPTGNAEFIDNYSDYIENALDEKEDND